MRIDDATLQSRARELAELSLASGQTVVTAESCTGGWIGKVCTDLPGSSRWFRGGAIVYDNDLKVRLAAVPPGVLASHGAVSEAVVRQMASAVLASLGGTLSVAVSGVAGPDGGTPEKPVGTVWFAWGRRVGAGTDVVARMHSLPGDRDAVRRQSVEIALAGLIQCLRSVQDG